MSHLVPHQIISSHNYCFTHLKVKQNIWKFKDLQKNGLFFQMPRSLAFSMICRGPNNLTDQAINSIKSPQKLLLHIPLARFPKLPKRSNPKFWAWVCRSNWVIICSDYSPDNDHSIELFYASMIPSSFEKSNYNLNPPWKPDF